jgi:ABC-type lipoprotein export system ATPase subunit
VTSPGFALELESVSKSYTRSGTRTRVLRNVTLALRRGEAVWLRGESGSGKSSLVRVAGLLSVPDSGQVRVLGALTHPGNAAARLRRSSIGVVFQHSNLLPELTVAENVALASPRADKAEVLCRLDRWGLGRLVDAPAKTVSGGEAQRVAFCRALLNDPDILLADEPTSGLDAANAAVVLEHLDAARREGRTVLVASHDTRFDGVCDRTVSIAGGRLV